MIGACREQMRQKLNKKDNLSFIPVFSELQLNEPIDLCQKITPKMLNNVKSRFEHNIYCSMEFNEQHFEHLLK